MTYKRRFTRRGHKEQRGGDPDVAPAALPAAAAPVAAAVPAPAPAPAPAPGPAPATSLISAPPITTTNPHDGSTGAIPSDGTVPPENKLTPEQQKNADRQLYFIMSENVSTHPNTDIDYVEKGIVHMTDSLEIRPPGGISSMFTKAEFDDSPFDKTRNDMIQKLSGLLEPDQKICNLRMDIAAQAAPIFFINMYGTLFQKEPSVMMDEAGSSHTDEDNVATMPPSPHTSPAPTIAPLPSQPNK